MTIQQLHCEHCPGASAGYESFRLQGWGEVRVYVLEPDLLRVLFLEHDALKVSNTWMVCPERELPWEGCDRLDVSHFSLPAYQCETSSESTRITTTRMRVEIEHAGLRMRWYVRINREWVLFAQDRRTQAYNFGQWGDGISHYLHRAPTEQYFGLGEKSGNMNRAGRRFRMMAIDAMGYDAETSDPLYKHIPFYITRDRRTRVAFGLFYDNLAASEFDMGQELDNYHGAYRYYAASQGDLDYYVMPGPTIRQVVKRFAWLTGPTLFGPKWSLGYSGSTMSYTDAPNAQELLQNFLHDCQRYGILCDSFQLSSGYTSIGAKRYVFNWNTEKIPQPAELVNRFHEAGIRLCANIKPCLLADHPLFAEVKAQGLFIRDRCGDAPHIAQFWDNVGAYLDFTNPRARAWWKQQITEKLLSYGIDATWNDNNECEIWDSEARCHGFDDDLPVGLIRPLHALLMMKASFEAQQEAHPDKRPYLISRSGCPGMQRYVQTWSGDNYTSWKTLRYNIRMGKGLSLSGIFNFGHDVGGFAGHAPEPELLARWVQNGIFHPRFTIHSWNDDGTVNEPWMYPEVLPLIRQQITFRYRLMPYFYTVLYRASVYNEPIIRPTFYDFEDDERTFEENDEFLCGPSLLVASVVEPGQRERAVYLPSGPDGWYDFHSGEWFPAGEVVTVPAPLESCPLFVPAGHIIPFNPGILQGKQREEQRQFRLYPPQDAGTVTYELFEDDGESWDYITGHYALVRLTMRATSDRITVGLRTEGEYPLPYQSVSLWFPPSEHRPLVLEHDADSTRITCL